MKPILALDLGTATGWALRDAGGTVISGTTSLKPGRFEGGGMRYLRFTNWLTELQHLSGPIAMVAFEEVRRHAATDAAHVYGGLMATLTAWCELRGIPYQGVPVGTIKKHATGKGNAATVRNVVITDRSGINDGSTNMVVGYAEFFRRHQTVGSPRTANIRRPRRQVDTSVR